MYNNKKKRLKNSHTKGDLAVASYFDGTTSKILKMK
jgi:hypothetical protein